jgi:hypothetical protein
MRRQAAGGLKMTDRTRTYIYIGCAILAFGALVMWCIEWLTGQEPRGFQLFLIIAMLAVCLSLLWRRYTIRPG